MKIFKLIQEKATYFSRRYLSLTINRENWDRMARFIPMTSYLLKYISHPVVGPYLRKITLFGGEGNHSQAHIMPINRDLDYKNRSKSVLTPIELVQGLIRESSYRVILHRCVCRDGFKCTNYPRDVGCIMLGEGTRRLVQSGIAREATIDEALVHLEKAAVLGLSAACAWPEAEKYIFGLSSDEYGKMMEICFCCECCCMGMRNYKYWHKNEELRKVFSSIGWRARTAEDQCVGCGVCVDACPKEAISLNAGKISIDEDLCLGCGICAYRCKNNAIFMEEVEPMKERIMDYFWGVRPQI